MTPTKVLTRIGPMFSQAFRPAGPACILATAIGVDVLRAYGIDARPLSVQVDLANAAWLQWHLDGRTGTPQDLLAAGGWMLSAGYPPERSQHFLPPTVPNAKPWDGHLMIELPGHASLMDLDLGQMNRPAKGIVLPPVGWFTDWNGTAGEWPLPGGCRIRIEAKRDDQTYQAARDWADPSKRQTHVAELVRAIRKGRVL